MTKDYQYAIVNGDIIRKEPKTPEQKKTEKYEKMIKARRVYEYAMGMMLVEALENNENMSLWVDDNCTKVICGASQDPKSLIFLSSASRERVNNALKQLNDWKEAQEKKKLKD